MLWLVSERFISILYDDLTRPLKNWLYTAYTFALSNNSPDIELHLPSKYLDLRESVKAKI